MHLAELLLARPLEHLVEGTACTRRALAITEAYYGPEDERVAPVLEILAIWLWHGREFESERPVVEWALRIRESVRPFDETKLVLDLHLLADLCFIEGDYGRALQLREREGPLRERVLGPRSDMVATHCIRMALVQLALGNREAALRLTARAASIREELLPARDSRLPQTLNYLGRMRMEVGDLDGAEVALERARTLWEILGKSNELEMADVLRSLGRLERKRDRLDKAVALYRRVAEIRVAALGPDHPLVGQTLAELGALEREQGDLAAARASLPRALDLVEKDKLRAYPSWAKALREQAMLDAEEGRLAVALGEALDAERISREHFRAGAVGLSERDALAQGRERVTGLGLAWEWASELEHRGALEEAAASKLLDEAIRSRALVFDTMAARQRTLVLHQDGETAASLEALRRADERLTRLVVEGTTEGMAEARADADRAERALAEKSRAYRGAIARGQPGLREVQHALPEGSALVSYFRQDQKPGAYVASVLLPGEVPPRVVPLGSVKEIEAAVQAWSAHVSTDPRLGGTAASEAAYRAAARDLALRIWDPVAPYLAGADRVFVVPDGALLAVSLATLVSAQQNYLVESGLSFHYLTAERDLVEWDEPSVSGSGLLAVGDPAYGASFTPLPGSRREVLEVGAQWSGTGPKKVLLGKEAQESTFRELAPAFANLHVATHAFFRFAEGADANPLRISGLALAGGADPSDPDDGILTAEEVALLDLRGVRWAVLSACASGRGALEPNEGVLGLRRAFQIAGAHTLIVSLWPVEDESTRYWMRALYDARRAGASTADAVQAAARGVLAEQRRTGGTTHPYAWGGFVSIGDWH